MYECIEHAAEAIFNSRYHFYSLLRWKECNFVHFRLFRLHVVSSLLDQCSKNEHYAKFPYAYVKTQKV